MTTRRKNDPAEQVTWAAKVCAGLGVVFSVFALGLYGWRPAASVLLGATIAVANLVTMKMIIGSLLALPEDEDPEAVEAEPGANHKEVGKRGGWGWGLFAVLKIVILFGGIWLLLSKDLVDPIPLVVGYFVLPLGIAASSLFSGMRVNRR